MRDRLPTLTLSTAALVAANLVPLGGVLLGFWEVYDLVLLFWAENVVVGVFQLLRMATVILRRRDYSLVALMPFFLVHYGLFTFVHGTFVLSLLAPPGEGNFDAAFALLLSPEGLLWAMLALVASHAFSFVVNFLGAGEWRAIGAKALMTQPYARVVVLHLVILFGGAASLALGEPMAALALLVVLKIGADIIAHRREHAGTQRAG
jgi:hypothetical protein